MRARLQIRALILAEGNQKPATENKGGKTMMTVEESASGIPRRPTYTIQQRDISEKVSYVRGFLLQVFGAQVPAKLSTVYLTTSCCASTQTSPMTPIGFLGPPRWARKYVALVALLDSAPHDSSFLAELAMASLCCYSLMGYVDYFILGAEGLK